MIIGDAKFLAQSGRIGSIKFVQVDAASYGDQFFRRHAVVDEYVFDRVGDAQNFVNQRRCIFECANNGLFDVKIHAA